MEKELFTYYIIKEYFDDRGPIDHCYINRDLAKRFMDKLRAERRAFQFHTKQIEIVTDEGE